MERYNLSLLTKRLLESKLVLMGKETVKDLLEIKNERTLYRVINDFVDSGVLVKVERGKYRVAGKGSTFETANFLYEPSYVSLETALNYWGILSQFPLETTSVTTKKTVKKEFEGRVYSYSQMAVKYFGMYVKIDEALVATAEKALFDQLYLASKGIKNINFDEYDMTKIDRKVFEAMTKELKASKKMMDLYLKIKKEDA
ncbi:hypothetical protein KJ909_01975 [Patescibacteria group bacterium]|nr:hypothetical protein [Patescibacteria group bacterium]